MSRAEFFMLVWSPTSTNGVMQSFVVPAWHTAHSKWLNPLSGSTNPLHSAIMGSSFRRYSVFIVFPTIMVPTVGSVLSISNGLEMAVVTIFAPFVTLNRTNTTVPDSSGWGRGCSIDVIVISTTDHETISHDSALELAHHSTEQMPLSSSEGASQENDNKRLLRCLTSQDESSELLHQWTEEETAKTFPKFGGLASSVTPSE